MLLILFLFCNALSILSDAILVYPDPNCNHSNVSTNYTTTLDTVFSHQWLLSNDTVLTLQEPGCYWLNNFYLIDDIDHLILTGIGVASEYIIKCASSGSGLSFVSITGLQLINVTIDGCNISGVHVNDTVKAFTDNIDVFYRIPHQINYGLIIADCSNISMTHVTILNTQGLGLLAINIMGHSSLDNVQFISNRATYCNFESLRNVTSDYTIGGGMFLSYHNYYDPLVMNNVKLSMKYMTFRENRYCSAFNSISSLYGQSATANSIGYVIGSAAGLGISLAQLDYSVNITIQSSRIINNTGLIGAGIHVSIFEDVRNSSITFNDCQFTSNGYSNTLPLGLHSQSAGLFIYDNLQFPNNTLFNGGNTVCTSSNSTSVSVNVVNSLFTNNQAHTCASYKVSSHRSTHVRKTNQNIFHVINTSFIGNQGSMGPVVCASSSEASGRQVSFQLIFHDVMIVNNSVRSTDGGVVNHLVESSGQLLLLSVHLELRGNTSFINNSGVAIVVINSLVSFQGNIQFIGNKGVFGGAIRIHTQSFLVIKDNSNISFINNQATVEGGAIYFSISSLADSNPLDEGDCFLYFNYVDMLCNYSSCPDIESMNFHLTFIDNTAHQGGTIYGSTLNSCPWFHYFTSNTSITALHFLSSMFSDKFHFTPALVNASVISTNSANLKLHNNYTNVYSTNPGGRISLEVLAYDAFDFRTSTALVSASENSSSISTRLGNSVYYYISSTDVNGTTVPLDVTGHQYQSVNVELFSVDSGIQSIITVSTTDCGPGFMYNSTTLMCECIAGLIKEHVICDVRHQTLIIPDNYWFGMLTKGDISMPVYSSCFYDYCRPSQTIVSVLDLNYQCNVGYNRGGLSCGVCMNDTSAVFGTSRCQDCSNIGLLWILGLAVAGIIVIFGISLLGITITEGYLNGFIFYCNSLNYFFVYLSPRIPLDPIFSPVAWVNLGLGIESCFYNGMSTLDRIGLRLVFPVYLFILMAIIVLLAQKVKKFASLRFSASKTFATLILLSYFSILGTCIEVMAFTRYTSLYGGGVSYTRWNLDPSQSYGHGLHGLLISIALLLLIVYIIPFPLLFLFPNLLYSLPFTNKFKPIYDAFWNPFKPRFRFWLSFRAMLRLIPFVLALFGSYPTNVLGMVIFVPLVWFMHERISPFTGYWQNSFDSFFLLNLMFLFIGNIYYERYRDEEYHYPIGYYVMVYTLVSTAYVAFLIILIIHVFIRFPDLKTKLSSVWKKKEDIVPKKLTSKISKSSIFLSQATNNIEEELPSIEHDELPRVVGYSELREPLLDEYGTIPLSTRMVVSS